MKHTPGPWRIEHDPDDQRIYIQDGEGLREVAYIDLPDEWDFANARLIAAAPMLLDALVEAARHAAVRCKSFGISHKTATGPKDHNPLCLKLRAAIAAATEKE